MDAEKYARNVEMLCPTCGGTQFGQSDDSLVVTCAGCEREMTKEELIAYNRERIDAQVEEMGHEIVEDAGKELKKMLQDAFRGNKYIKVK